jgi:hypothetical protein
MDNLGSHKGVAVGEAIEAAGAKLLYLPPYSPDFNPIETACAKLKALVRKAADGGPSTTYGPPSARSFQPSRQANAPTTSPPPTTTHADQIPL